MWEVFSVENRVRSNWGGVICSGQSGGLSEFEGEQNRYSVAAYSGRKQKSTSFQLDTLAGNANTEMILCNLEKPVDTSSARSLEAIRVPFVAPFFGLGQRRPQPSFPALSFQ